VTSTDWLSPENLLKLAEVASILGGGVVVAFRLGRTTQRFETAVSMQGRQINMLQADVRELNKLMTEVAVQATELNSIRARIDLMDKRYEEMRHGEGYVMPIFPKVP
jgi:hypothetical protein